MGEKTKLTFLEQDGKDFEEKVENDLGVFKQFITYSNPKDNHGWKRARGRGTDLNLAVGKYKIFTEIKHNRTDYLIPAKWFADTGLRRFSKLPNPDKFNLHLILTNRPDNWNDVKLLANYFGISIITNDDLLSLITDILSDNINNNSILTNDSYITNNDNINNDNININNNNNTYQNKINPNKTIERDIFECVVYYFLQKNNEEPWLNG